MADRFGRKPVFLASVVVFTTGSLLSGLSTSLPMLVVFRIAQGAGGGILSPVGLAMVYEVFPPDERGGPSGCGAWRPWRLRQRVRSWAAGC